MGLMVRQRTFDQGTFKGMESQPSIPPEDGSSKGGGTQKACEVNGVAIETDADRLVSLTDLWRASGADENKKPAEWIRNKPSKEFVSALAANLKVGIPTLTKVRRGKHFAGTWAHWQIAMAYAKYLSPEFHQHVNEGFRQWQEEYKDPSLKIDRAIDRWKEIGKEDQWIKVRFDGQLQRKSLMATMADHNCRQMGAENPYKIVSTTGNLSVIGKTAKEFKEEKGLTKSATTRDHLESHQLAALNFFEAMTEKRIKDTAADGNSQCIECASEVGKVVKQAMSSLSA